MSFYPRSGSEEDHNKVLDLNQCPGLTNAAEALDPNFMGGFLMREGFDIRNLDDEYFEWQGDAMGSTDGYTPPTKAELKAKVAELLAEWDSKVYQRHRAIEYPEMTEQLDMIYHDQLNGTTNWRDAIDAVKSAYPKPN